MFVRDKDPISVQCLACGGGEIIEALAEAHGEEPFAMHILETQPDMDRRAKITKTKKPVIGERLSNNFSRPEGLRAWRRRENCPFNRCDDTNGGAGLFPWLVRIPGAQRCKRLPPSVKFCREVPGSAITTDLERLIQA